MCNIAGGDVQPTSPIDGALVPNAPSTETSTSQEPETSHKRPGDSAGEISGLKHNNYFMFMQCALYIHITHTHTCTHTRTCTHMLIATPASKRRKKRSMSTAEKAMDRVMQSFMQYQRESEERFLKSEEERWKREMEYERRREEDREHEMRW